MMTGFERYTKKTRRAQFLEEMGQVVPWRKLCAPVEPHYPKVGKRRPPQEAPPHTVVGGAWVGMLYAHPFRMSDSGGPEVRRTVSRYPLVCELRSAP